MEIDSCPSCGSKNIKAAKVSFKHLGTTVEDVPVIQCLDCDEEMVMSNILERVENLIREGITVYTESCKKKHKTLEERITGFSDDYKCTEWDTGKPSGKEV